MIDGIDQDIVCLTVCAQLRIDQRNSQANLCQEKIEKSDPEK